MDHGSSMDRVAAFAKMADWMDNGAMVTYPAVELEVPPGRLDGGADRLVRPALSSACSSLAATQGRS